MPKKIPKVLPPMPEPEEQELTEEEAEVELADLEQQKANLIARQAPAPVRKAPVAQPMPVQPQPQAPASRYTSLKQEQVEGIIDAETKEVIATDLWTALAKIMESQERIENSIGSMLES